MADLEPVEVLLVEDCATDAELALRALRRMNLANRVHWVKDGAEALDFLFCTGNYADRRTCNPKLILLDLNLPKVNGLEVLEAVRADERTRDIPITVLTASADERDVGESYRRHVNSYIVKPVDASQFIDAVAKANFYWIAVNRPPA